MRREIKFRAWDVVGHKWVYGDLVHNMKVVNSPKWVEPRTMVGGYEVDPESVGQFTGLKDTTGKEIYEKDVLEVSYNGKVLFRSTVIWHEKQAAFYLDEGDGCFSPIPTDYVTVVDIDYKQKEDEDRH